MLYGRILAAVVSGVVLLMGDGAAAAKSRFISIGTAGVTGVYFPAGGAICRFVNKNRQAHGIRCTVEATGGSVANINGVRSGSVDFALVQSDLQFVAYNGTSDVRNLKAFKDMRSVFSLHIEPFTVVARADAGIRRFADLKGRRVNIGNAGSGQRGTMDMTMQAMGWTVRDFSEVFELGSDEQSRALCANRIDAMVFVAGFPSGSVKEATTLCRSVLVDVEGGAIDALVRDNVFYRKTVIPGGVYAGADRDVVTFGALATVITSTRIPESVVYRVVQSVFENFAEFRKQHPAFRDLKPANMVTDGLAAPVHPGALRYYREKGWR